MENLFLSYWYAQVNMHTVVNMKHNAMCPIKITSYFKSTLTFLGLAGSPFLLTDKTRWRAKRAPHWAVQLRFCMIYICRYVCRYVCWFVYKKYVCRKAWAQLRGPKTHMLKVSLGQLKLTFDTRIIHFNSTLEQL